MAGPVPPYLTTQTAAQTAFTVPFGLISFVNAAIATAVAAGEFNVTVDCSLFVTEDVSNLRIYLDSLGYTVEFAKNTNEKSLNIDWGKFLDDATDATTVYQGTSPWIVAGTVTANQGAPGVTPWPVTGSVTTSPDVNVHDGVGNPITSTGGALDVNVSFPSSITVDQGTSPWIVSGNVSVSNFPAVQPISGTVIALQGTSPWTVDGTIDVGNFPAIQAVSQSGVWTTGRTWTLASGTDSVNVGNFPATQPVSGTVTALQGTSPWVVSGSITTSPDVNVHDGSGNAISSTGTSLDVNVTDFPATVAVTQSTSPWVVSGSVAVTNFPATVAVTQSTSPWVVAGTIIADQGTSPWVVSGTVAATQSGAWSVAVSNFPAVQPVSGTVTANQGTSPWVVSGTVAATQSGAWTTGRTWALASGTDSVAAVQSGGWTVAGTGNFTVVQPTGTNLHTVLDSGTLTSITNALPAGTNVIGHVITDSGSTTAVTGNVTVVQPTGTNLHTVVDSGSITVNNAAGASAVNIQDGGNIITVDGTVTANQGTPNTLANAWAVEITDGTDSVIVDTDGSLFTKPVPVGTHGNAWNAATVSVGNNSAVIDLQYCRTVSIFGNSSNNLNPMRVQASQDNVNYFTLTTFAISTGNFGVTIDFGARYLRLQSGQGTNFTVTATVAGK